MTRSTPAIQTRRRFGSALAIGWLLLAAAPGPAQVVNGVRVQTSGIGAGQYAHGYAETRFHLENLSGQREARVTLEIRQQYSSGSPSLSWVRRTVSLAPNARVVVDLPRPPVEMNGSTCTISVNGRSETITSPFIASYQGWDNNIYGLASRSLGTQTLQDRLLVSGGGGRHGGGQAQITRAEWTLDQWPTHWRSYSRFDLVILSQAEWDGLPGPVRRALEQYAESGGFLLLAGVPTPDLARHPVEVTPSLRMSARGFGRIAAWSGADFEPLQGVALDMIRNTAMNTRGGMNSLTERIPGFQAKDDVRVPLGGFFILMILFAAVVGPVNYVVLTRLNRRLLLLVTVPALSIGACLILLVYSLVSEGTRPTVRTFGFTLLDQRKAEAVTLGVQAYYSPLTPGDGLRFGADVEIDPLFERRSYSGNVPMTIDFTEGQHLASGWVRARIPASFRLRSHEPRRERLDVVRTENGLEVINALGADIVEAWVADDQGRVHKIWNLSQGSRVRLEPSTRRAEGNPMVLREALEGGNWPAQTEKLAANPYRLLQPRTYLAKLAGAPFVESGLKGRAHVTSSQMVYGHFEEIAP